MADNYLLGDYEAPQEAPALATAGDFAKTLGVGTANVGSNLAAALRYGWELGGSEAGADIGAGLQKIFRAGGDAIEDTINPETRKLAAATLTSDEFWAHPILGTALKATGMAPSIAAAAIPGGLLADAVGASIFAAAAGGALNAGAGLDEFYKKLDEMPDDELQAQSTKYRVLREMMDEKPARERFNREAQSWGPALNAIIGAASGAVGPAGVAARGLAGAGKAGANAVIGAGDRGVLGSAGIAAAEGAAANAVEEGVSNLTVQKANINADLQKELDLASAANAALEGGVMGGLFGGAVGAVVGGAKAPETVKRANKELDAAEEVIAPVTTTDVHGPQPHTGSATAQPAKPVESAEVGNPQNEPTRSERDLAKKDTKTAAPKEPVAPVPQPVDPAIAQAVASNDGEAVTAQPTEVAAMTERSPNATLDILDREGQVPPEVTPAPAAPEAPLDTGQNVPETPQSLTEQIAQIGTGDRKAIMVPAGTVVPANALKGRKDLRRLKLARGTFIYDPKLTNIAEIKKLSKLGRENEILGLGPVSKPEAVADAAAGAQPVAIVERTGPLSEIPGTEVKAAAGTTATLPEQRAALEAQKSPGNEVTVETPEAVIEKRNAQGGRIIETNTQNVVNLTENLARAEAADEAKLARIKKAEAEEAGAPSGPGTNYRGERGRKRDAAIATAKEVVEANPPNAEKERGAHALPKPRGYLIQRARNMVEQAEKKLGKPIQSQIKKSKDGKSTSDSPYVLTLRIAKDLVKAADRKSPSLDKMVKDYVADEFLISKGFMEDVIARRLEEGNRDKKQTGTEEGLANLKVEEDPKGLDEEDFPSPDEKTDDEAPGPAGVDIGVEDTVARADDEVEFEAPESELKQGPSVKHIEVKLEKAKSTLSPREAKKAALAAAAAKAKLAPAAVKNDNAPRARMAVDRNPTEAQKIAGNYKKGHRRVEGLDFTIENPKGAVRRGRDEDGTEWGVTMPAAYGYIRRTTGADGDHVDAYDGGTGSRFFVIDQLDTRTGQFDEHKVMMRFKDEAAAIDAYKRAFSDGKGEQRLGNIHEVTPAELKAWLNDADTTKPITQHAMSEARAADEDFDLDDDFVGGPFFDQLRAQLLKPPVKLDKVTVWGGDNDITVSVLQSRKLGDTLADYDMSDIPGVPGYLGKFFKRQVEKLAANVDVHYVDGDTMAKVAGYDPDGPRSAAGLHIFDGPGRDADSVIFLNVDSMDGTTAHTVIHEAVHAITVREIHDNPRMFRAIGNIAYQVNEFMQNSANRERIKALEDQGYDLKYAFTDPYEFVAESFSNAGFQKLLATIRVDRATAEAAGLKRGGVWSVWDVVRKMVRDAVFGRDYKGPKFDTALDAIMKVGETLTTEHARTWSGPRGLGQQGPVRTHDFANKVSARMVGDAADAVKNWLARPEANTAANTPWALALRTFDNIAQIADHYFGENNPVRKIHESIERTRVAGEKIFQRSEPIIRTLASLRAKNGEQFREFSSLLHDATVANVHPDVSLSDARNAHLGKNRVVGKAVWSKAQHAELSKRFNALPEDFKKAWHQTVKHFTDRQNEMSLAIINNQILKLIGVNDAALAQRIHDGSYTDADRAFLGSKPDGKNIIELIEAAGELSKIDGPYVPLMRRGDWVVKGDYKVTRPGNAKEVRDGAGNVIPNQFQFDTEKEAEAYAKTQPLQTEIKKVWLDTKSGERTNANELDAVDRYRVSVQDRHVEFVQGRRAAQARAAELARDGSIDVHEVVPRAFEPNARQGAELSTALSRLVAKLEHSAAYEAASPTQRAALKQAINEAALASHGSTRISSKALPRRGVEGYSEDLVQNTADYGESSSRYLAKLEHAPALEAALKEMAEGLKRDESKVGQAARTLISNEVRKRVEGENGFQQGGAMAPVIKRLLSASFTDKLGSPAYSIINGMQVGMVTAPYLSARHGVGRTFAALGKAYSDIGGLGIVKQGAKGTYKALKGQETGNDFIASIMKNLSPNEKKMIEEHLAVGTIDPSAGMEISKINPDRSGVGGKADAVLGYLEGVTREMPRAIESINRSVSAIAAYRMEIARGVSHEQAVQYSKDVVNNTQFNYSPTNSPGVFNHPLLKIALQFKKYGQGMYQMIGTQIGNAIRNEKPGDRATAVKTLIGVAATHMAMAGALGLPTEPFKYLLMPLHGMGLIDMSWSDVENELRRQAATVLGKTGGEVFSRGLPRVLGLDLSRMGLDSVTSFGEPRSNKSSDVKAWFFDSLSGPVVSLGGDYVKGVTNLANGDVAKAAEQLIPLKAASDTLRAYRQATEGKKSASGKKTSEPYSPSEAALRVLGFGNAREAEEGAANSAYYRQSARQKEQRTELMNEWVQAKPAEKTKAWAAIVKWNQSQPADARIKPAELTSKAKRDAKNEQTAVRGINAKKQDKRFLEEGIYNVR